jgi:hypothetical protein
VRSRKDDGRPRRPRNGAPVSRWTRHGNRRHSSESQGSKSRQQHGGQQLNRKRSSECRIPLTDAVAIHLRTGVPLLRSGARLC